MPVMKVPKDGYELMKGLEQMIMEQGALSYDEDELESLWDKIYRALFIHTSFECKTFKENLKRFIEK
jgi:hypothetical protein